MAGGKKDLKPTEQEAPQTPLTQDPPEPEKDSEAQTIDEVVATAQEPMYVQGDTIRILAPKPISPLLLHNIQQRLRFAEFHLGVSFVISSPAVTEGSEEAESGE